MNLKLGEELGRIGNRYGTNKFREHHYNPWYEKHIGHLRNSPFTLLEIGVLKGASLRVWREYFPKATIYGIDADPEARKNAPPGIEVFLGDQEDSVFLERVIEEIGAPHVVIDDGGHKMGQQKTSFKTLFPLMPERGVYVIEDLFTSYRKNWGGGAIGSPGTTLSMLKECVDEVNRKEHRMAIAPAPISQLHFYQFIAFIVKK